MRFWTVWFSLVAMLVGLLATMRLPAVKQPEPAHVVRIKNPHAESATAHAVLNALAASIRPSRAFSPAAFMLAAAGQVAPPFAAPSETGTQAPAAQPQPAAPVAISVPRTPAAAVALALADIQRLSPAARFQRRYIWLPDATKIETANVIFSLNTGPNISTVDYVPIATAGGVLIPVDLSAMVEKGGQLQHLIDTWNDFSTIEPYFHVHLHDAFDEDVREPCEPYRAADGKTYSFHVHKVHRTGSVRHLAAPHLGEAGLALEAEVGNLHPEICSYSPIVRADWFNSISLAAADTGFYYRFRNLVPGKTKLKDYLISRGVDRKDAENADATDQEIVMSQVTGRARAIVVLGSSHIKLSAGTPIVVITQDNRQDRIDPAQDPILSFLDHKPDAFEVIVKLPNGWLEYTIWNGEELLIVETDSRVVTDDTIPRHYPHRLQAAISCIRCHGPSDGWQPFDNEFKAMMGDRGRLLTDLSHGDGIDQQFDQWKTVQSRFRGDLMPVISDAQDSYDRHIHKVLGIDGKAACDGEAASYAAYNYTPITAMTALTDIGFKAAPNDTLGVETFRTVVPPLHPDGFIPDHGFITRLSTLFNDPRTAQKRTLTLTRLQYEQIFPDIALRSYPALRKAQGAK